MSAPRHGRAAVWNATAEIRDEWLSHGTACGSTDQEAAELAITRLYENLRRPRPEFVWVRSPHEARPLVEHLPTVWDLPPYGKCPPPLASDFATAVSRLRGRMDERITTPWFDPKPPKRDKGDKWPDLRVQAGLDYGIPFIDIVRRHVRDELFKQLAHGFYLPGKQKLGSGPVCWYGQQEAHWIAYYDVWRRLGLADYGQVIDAEFDTWQAIARGAGWFWLDEHVCVVSQKPLQGTTFADGWKVA